MKWDVMDIRKMSYQDNSFHLIIDKSTFDALLCGDFMRINVALALGECHRVVKTGGALVAVSYGAPETRESHFQRNCFGFQLRTFEIHNEHYVYVCTKMEGADETLRLNYLQELKKIVNDIGQRALWPEELDLVKDKDSEFLIRKITT